MINCQESMRQCKLILINNLHILIKYQKCLKQKLTLTLLSVMDTLIQLPKASLSHGSTGKVGKYLIPPSWSFDNNEMPKKTVWNSCEYTDDLRPQSYESLYYPPEEEHTFLNSFLHKHP